VQARLGQALFLLLVLWTMAVREAICAQLWKQRIHKKICSNAVGVGALDDPFKRLSQTLFEAQTKRLARTKSLLQREKVAAVRLTDEVLCD